MRFLRSMAVLAVLGLFVAGCGDDGEGGPGVGSGGFVSEDFFRERQREYLEYATTELSPGSITNVIAHLERKRVDPAFDVPDGAVPADAWDDTFARFATLEDTRDFRAIELLSIVYEYADDPMLAPGLVEKVEEALLSFKSWYDEPTPEGIQDDTWYWTENHQILFFAIEYLTGALYPDRPMSTDGALGAEHRERGREKLLRWIDLRARFGFSEWHSNVYYQEDLNGLLTVVELAPDEEVRTRAAMALDLLLFDLAMHTQRGAFGVTHGRSYKKDKMTSLHDDTWGGVKFLFDLSEYPYQSRSHSDATLLARAHRYRPPELVLRVARHVQPFVDRERMGIRVDEMAPVTPDPVAPYGFSYDDPDDLMVWWGASQLTAWQIVPLTLETIETYNFWESELFEPFAQLRPLAMNPSFAQTLAQNTSRITSFGHLTEVSTYTYRTGDYMLSTALDYRAGSLSSQAHVWQLTFDPNAVIMTTHPAAPLMESTRWRDDNESTGGYWTGSGSLPRSAQYENVAIHIYAPQFDPTNPPPFDVFGYEPFTHAYVPQDHFDEVVRAGGWTFVRFRDGYAGLYSHRPTEWLVYDPARYATNGMEEPFDLLAPGGADNVWIVEAGSRDQWGSFEAFREALLAAEIQITPTPPSGAEQTRPAFDVAYDSPSQGRVELGWTAPFVVDGVSVPLFVEARYDNPWAQTPFDQHLYRLEDDAYAVELDFTEGRREVIQK